jgi:hypothetical protein
MARFFSEAGLIFSVFLGYYVSSDFWGYSLTPKEAVSFLMGGGLVLLGRDWW